MTDLKLILEYQDTDIKLRKATDSIEKSDAARNAKKAKAEFEATKKSVEDSETGAGEILEFVKKAGQVGEDAVKKIGECKAKIEGGNLNADERKQMKAELEALKNKLSDYEKKIDSKRKRGSKVLEEYRDSQAKGKRMIETFNKEKEAFTKLKDQKEPEIKSLKKQLDELRPKVDKKLMDLYDELAAEKKVPPFVDAYEMSKGVYSCRGCGLQLSQAENAKLSSDGICRCGSCRRVIYISKN